MSESSAVGWQRTLVIPMWNEQERIGATVAALAASTLNTKPIHIILADDGSTDNTRSVAQQALDAAVTSPDISGEVLALPHAGKGATVRAGILAAKAEFIAFTDADLSAPPEDINSVFEALETDRGQVVAGIRTSDDGDPPPPMRKLARTVMRSVVRGLQLTSVPDTQCGLKGFTREAAHAILEPLQTDGFAFDVEVLARAERLGLKVHSEPVAWRHGEGSTVRVARDTPAMIAQMLKMLWNRRKWPTSL